MSYEILSRHFFRRTARAKLGRVQRKNPTWRLRVAPAHRGPFRWYVVKD